MKRMSICLIAAVAMLALAAVPAMACNNHPNSPYKAKSTVDFWEYCSYAGELNGESPVGPASYYDKDVLINFKGEQNFSARVKNNKVTWHRHIDGTAYVYGATGSASVSSARAASIMSNAPKVTVQSSVSPYSMYIFQCFPWEPAPDMTGVATEHTGPFALQEIVQDLGNGFACFDPTNPAPVSFYECLTMQGGDLTQIDYMMYHVKITGPGKPYHFKTTIEPGKFCYDEKRGYASCMDF
jgi:hypothetical protein